MSEATNDAPRVPPSPDSELANLANAVDREFSEAFETQKLNLATRARNWLGELDLRRRKKEQVPPEAVNPPCAESNSSAEDISALSTSGDQLAVVKLQMGSNSRLDELPESWLATIVAATSTQAGTLAETARINVVKTLIAGIRSVSVERDRDEILRWFIDARQILANADLTKAEAAKQLYGSINTLRVGQLVTNIASTGLRNYKASRLPLALKIALPITAVGTAFVGAQGAGIAAFGGAIGAPVALLLFLGTAGATSIIEAFIRDRSIRDPLTRLMLTFVAFKTSRRARKELLAAMRADAMTPMRADVPDDDLQVREFLFQMDPIAFERHVMSFFEEAGHPTGLTPRSNDFGVDSYMFHPDGIVVVQCKRYASDNAVGRPAIQQFKGVVEEQKAFRGYVVTTSRFTDEAQESAAKSNRIVLVDGALLAKWHRDGFALS